MTGAGQQLVASVSIEVVIVADKRPRVVVRMIVERVLDRRFATGEIEHGR
jgi:hypothetical protein